jgi:hypothetical protein
LTQFEDLSRFAHDPRVWYGAGAGVVFVALVILYRWRNRPPSPDESERLRRLHVNHVGRIAEGRVIDLMKVDPPDTGGRGLLGMFGGSKRGGAAIPSRQMVCYSYSISGVTYETAQDVTGLESRVATHRLVPGQPASVKYDPSNPSNSILVADDWSGLH